MSAPRSRAVRFAEHLSSEWIGAQCGLFGPVTSVAKCWRALGKIAVG